MKTRSRHQRIFVATSLFSIAFFFPFYQGCSRTDEPQERNREGYPRPDRVEGSETMQDRNGSSRTNSPVEVDTLAPRTVLRSDPALPDQTRTYLELVSNITAKLRWEEDRPIRIEETDAEFIVVWPSRYEGSQSRHGDYEARAVIDKRTRSIISLKRGP